MTEITSRFSSLAEMQAGHDELLDRREGLPEGDAAAASFWPEVAAFVRRGAGHRRRLGRVPGSSRGPEHPGLLGQRALPRRAAGA